MVNVIVPAVTDDADKSLMLRVGGTVNPFIVMNVSPLEVLIVKVTVSPSGSDTGGRFSLQD